MPNHFHLLVHVNEVELSTEGFAIANNLSSIVKLKESTEINVGSEALGKTGTKPRTFNQSIGIMLRAYTNAINKQNNTSGSLFRKETKAECLNCLNGITPSFYNSQAGTKIHLEDAEKQYPKTCFDYIHQNPVKSNLVKEETDWEFSSAQDYAGLRKGTLVNKKRAKEYFLF
jgi:putative transposase